MPGVPSVALGFWAGVGSRDETPRLTGASHFLEHLFGANPPGSPVFGPAESIGAMSRDSVARYWRRHYASGNLVVAVAGNRTHDEVVELVSDAFEGAAGEPLGPRPGRRE